MDTVEKIMNGKKTTVHLLFCIIVLLLFYTGTWFLNMAGFSFGDVPLVFARSVFYLLCIYTGRWLCESWYFKNKLLILLLLIPICCFIILLLWWVTIKYLFGHSFAGFVEVLVNVLPFFMMGIILGILFKLISTGIKKRIHDADAGASQMQSELNLLQSQLSPHFLFNTLNNIYGIAIAHHERVPDLLLKLSDLLRYTVYEAKNPFVPLADELAYINNYIDFEKIRISDRLVLQKDIDNTTNNNLLIAPMLLIVFVENAFKHAK
ncbi:MAG: histidine kinase, partial [Bacteroidota bacterium]